MKSNINDYIDHQVGKRIAKGENIPTIATELGISCSKVKRSITRVKLKGIYQEEIENSDPYEYKGLQLRLIRSVRIGNGKTDVTLVNGKHEYFSINDGYAIVRKIKEKNQHVD